jgi:hypothetical protein
MVAIRPSLSDDTAAPAEVKALANELIAIVNRHDSRIAGPAVSMLFSFVILECAGRGSDMAALSQILQDVSQIITRYGAAIPRHAH